MQALILCGGLGTRLGEEYKDVPKGLVLVNNKPILQYQIELMDAVPFKNQQKFKEGHII